MLTNEIFVLLPHTLLVKTMQALEPLGFSCMHASSVWSSEQSEKLLGYDLPKHRKCMVILLSAEKAYAPARIRATLGKVEPGAYLRFGYSEILDLFLYFQSGGQRTEIGEDIMAGKYDQAA